MPSSNEEVKKTNRGFGIYVELTDEHQQTVRVQESSSIDPCVWIFCQDRNGNDAVMHLGEPRPRSPHLSPSQARGVAKALIAFAQANEPKRKPKPKCGEVIGEHKCTRPKGHDGRHHQ